jgi:hypothetical protein
MRVEKLLISRKKREAIMNMQREAKPRYEFRHGADVEVKYLGPRDVPGKIEKDVFAVTAVGQKVFFEMMRLLPRDEREAQKPRKWGFGDITDPTTGRQVWDFNSFARPLNFRGDMTTVCGEDNRTYVECRARDGTLKHRFLLTELLPRWNAARSVVVSSLPVPEPSPVAVAQPVSELIPELVATPAPVPVTAVSKQTAAVVEPQALPEPVLSDLVKVRDRLDGDMLEFVTGAFARMMRAPAHLRLS